MIAIYSVAGHLQNDILLLVDKLHDVQEVHHLFQLAQQIL